MTLMILQTFTVETDNLSEDNEQVPPLRNPPILEAAGRFNQFVLFERTSSFTCYQVRYSQLNIYTYSGIVLIATNPFQRVDQLYSQDIIQAYAGKRRGELDPHFLLLQKKHIDV